MTTSENIFLLIVFLFVLIAVFFLLRNLNLWYFRIDDRFNETKKTNELLTELIRTIKGETTEQITEPTVTPEKEDVPKAPKIVTPVKSGINLID